MRLMSAASAAVTLLLAVSIVAATDFPNDFRVTPGFGDRAGEHVRITYTTDAAATHNAEFEAAFPYNADFEYRWKKLRAHTGLYNVSAGQPTPFAFPGSTPFNVTIPRLGDGVRGVMTADICFASGIATCETGEHDEIFSHLPVLLNSIMGHPVMNFWSVIGDNFYDADGSLTRLFWSTLSTTVKSKIFLAAPGNYDFWSSGEAHDVVVAQDQFGNGYMQYYGMDTESSAVSGAAGPWNFSVNPDTVDALGRVFTAQHNPQPNQRYLPDASNFQYYTQVGNLGVVSYSGAHHHSEIESFFARACTWFTSGDRASSIDWILVVGHWSRDTSGASDKTMTPAMAAQAVKDLGCPAAKTYYFEGHTHCNMPTGDGGFIVGGFGKSNNHCSQFGIPYLDTTGDRLQVVYFPISKQMVPSAEDTPEQVAAELKGAHERYALLSQCVAVNPISECLFLEHDVWLNVSKSG
uniref:Calcineurin-like phosphoesterase domain-containing protein n=1 Tax=Neobodo designis TaxID=312471 RepID=A0A7S1MSJ1_NEODS|mmetsp:Transcript_46351/g.143004  ORF Transcript_46351/g.143004 Transcript_46351/m.143004 type:complete len:464 (+) Transcript_46351:43-1434(+)